MTTSAETQIVRKSIPRHETRVDAKTLWLSCQDTVEVVPRDEVIRTDYENRSNGIDLVWRHGSFSVWYSHKKSETILVDDVCLYHIIHGRLC